MNYDGDPSNKSWIPACGVRPSKWVPFPYTLFDSFTNAGSSLFCGLIHAPEIYASWKSFYAAKVAAGWAELFRRIGNFLGVDPSSAMWLGGQDANDNAFIEVDRPDTFESGRSEEQNEVFRFASNYQVLFSSSVSARISGANFLGSSDSNLECSSKQMRTVEVIQQSPGARGYVMSPKSPNIGTNSRQGSTLLMMNGS